MAPQRDHSLGLQLSLVLACLTILALGCGESECNRVCSNLPPETWLTSEAPIRTCDTFSVKIGWTGEDPDGSVDGFEVATLTAESIYIVLSDLELDPLVWGFTTASESTFTVALDSCCVSEGATADSLAYWAVFVRAVDNRGARDPRPEVAVIKACNVLPRVKIVTPDIPDTVMPCLPQELLVEWEGEDPDGDPTLLEYKYILLARDYIRPDWGELPPFSYEGSSGGHAAPPIGMWSEWVTADCTYVADLDVGFVPPSSRAFKYIVVTARDASGGVLTPDLFSVYNQDQNWFRFTTCQVTSGVELVIWSTILGRRTSRDRGGYFSEVSKAMPGSQVRFTFYAGENRGSCEITRAYRYYYDDPADPATSAWDEWIPVDPIRRPGNVPEWWVSFPEDGRPLVPEPGMHRFVAEAKDACGVISHCELQFEIPSCRRPRGICLIDDDRAKWVEPVWSGYEEAQDGLWDDILDGYEWQAFDTGRDYERGIPLELICDSQTVIWVADFNPEDPWTQLLQVCAGNLGNYLRTYVNSGGNLILIGRDPVYAAGYWPDGTPNPYHRATFTDWDFRPRWNSAFEETLYHWMWETFGIERMKLPAPALPIRALLPCDGCHPAFADTIMLGPEAGIIGYDFENAAYITRVRKDFDVIPLYSTGGVRDGDWVESGSDNPIAIYVPASGTRGHAAYIGVAEYWFDHAGMTHMIRELLYLFGHSP